MKIEDGVLEVMITDYRIALVHKATFLKEIGISENPKDFCVQEPMSEQFESFLTQIGYNSEFKAKEFKKSVVPSLWTILMHLNCRILSSTHGDTDTMSKFWFYVVYIIFSRKKIDVDLLELIWKEFQNFSIKRKSNEIPSPRFWALTL